MWSLRHLHPVKLHTNIKNTQTKHAAVTPAQTLPSLCFTVCRVKVRDKFLWQCHHSNSSRQLSIIVTSTFNDKQYRRRSVVVARILAVFKFVESLQGGSSLALKKRKSKKLHDVFRSHSASSFDLLCPLLLTTTHSLSQHSTLLTLPSSECVTASVCVWISVCVREKDRRADGLPLCVHVCAFACVYTVCVCVCVHLRSSLWWVVEGVLICHLALQVKPESSRQLRGRGINNTKGRERERERERE